MERRPRLTQGRAPSDVKPVVGRVVGLMRRLRVLRHAFVLRWMIPLLAVFAAGCGTSADAGGGKADADGRPSITADEEVAADRTTSPAATRQLFVDPDGSDAGSGTSEEPFGRLTVALERLQPGDTLIVRGGTYSEDVVLKDELTPGTAAAPVVVRAAPGERPVIEGRLALYGADHWHLRGINVTWSERNDSNDHMVVFNGGVGFRFSHAEIWGARSFAAIVTGYGSRDFRLDHLFVHDTYESNGPNQDHLIYLSADSTGGIVERNVLARSPNGRGVKLGPGSLSEPGASANVIRYNTFYANGGPSNIQLSGESSDNEIYGNLLVRPGRGSEAVTAWNLEGTANVVRDNAVWDAVGVLEGDDGIIDGGGNVRIDPKFADADDGDFRPTNPEASAYGAFAER